MLRELRAHFEKWRILGYFLAKFPLEKPKITILTYNCAHLKSTKESVTFEYLEKKKIFFFTEKKKSRKGRRVKYSKKESIFLQRRRKMEKEKEGGK